MGPVEALYLNQIATFRLARLEVKLPEHKSQTKTKIHKKKEHIPSPGQSRPWDSGSLGTGVAAGSISGGSDAGSQGYQQHLHHPQQQEQQPQQQPYQLAGQGSYYQPTDSSIDMPDAALLNPLYMAPAYSGEQPMVDFDDEMYQHIAEQMSDYMIWDGYLQN